jgi:type I restriction enzyme R subunit
VSNEADTCRKYVVPRLVAAGWEVEPHAIDEQYIFTDGRIVVAGRTERRRPGKRADYLLRYTRDFPIAVVEAKADYKTPGTGMQQAKDYAEILGLKFAFATNGAGIVEFDYLTGRERLVDAFPTPDELWARLRSAQGLTDDAAGRLLAPLNRQSGNSPRYYQEIAINRVVQAILQGQKRVLLTMATGTGKTPVAFHICWKLWQARWNRAGEHRRPRILFLADRAVLVDDPKDKHFAAFGDARWKIENGEAIKSRELYFATYQAIARDERRPGLYRAYAPDFFDLIVVDECHRGSARDDSVWREILEYFAPAYQLGLTATPLREETRDTYAYFGNAVYTYSLRQGIDDGFLAPYRVQRVVTTWDAVGWRPSQGELDRYGRPIPDDEYQTKDFERVVALRSRTELIARHLTAHLKATDRFAKTLVFCVDQEHADEMRRALTNLNADLVKQYPDYVCRVTADEGDIGRGHLSRFQDPERTTPAILTTSHLLTTGVDAPTVKNVALARVVGSLVEFKQIIGRGTRVREDYGKLTFTILDYTGTATRNFADPDFDGDPIAVVETTIDGAGAADAAEGDESQDGRDASEWQPDGHGQGGADGRQLGEERVKYYVDGGRVEIAARLVYELDADGNQLRVVVYADYAAEKVRAIFRSAADLRDGWAEAPSRVEIVARLAERGIDLNELAAALNQPEADPLDLLCHLAFDAPLRTRRERAERLRREKPDFFDRYGPEARAVLDDLLTKYAEHGADQFAIPDVLKVPPISARGNVSEIIRMFGGAEALRSALIELQRLLYAA